MKKINALSFLTQEERDATEKLLQSVSISDNRNTVTKFLTNFEQLFIIAIKNLLKTICTDILGNLFI